MKSTMHYLVLGLALAGVPLLAEADAQEGWGEPQQIAQANDAHSLLNGQQELQLLQVEQRGEQAYLRLQTQSGEQLLVQALTTTSESPSISGSCLPGCAASFVPEHGLPGGRRREMMDSFCFSGTAVLTSAT